MKFNWKIIGKRPVNIKRFFQAKNGTGDAAIIAAVILAALSMLAPVSAGDSTIWSSYLGRMNREDAIARCAGMGMRLPTIDELKFIYASGESKSWEKDTEYYWSATGNGTGIYCLQNIRKGGVCYGLSVDTAGVRCRR